ncbi:MAG: ABC transporter ATP-binding protein [Proteobacteria bacterium]|nr:ABC transporter ATP-binding protein [Pseudomonadota bacterium]
MAAVTVRNLRVVLGGQPVIDALDLEVADGEFLVLLGPSGCGKSTLLHAMAGLIDVSGGHIEIDGVDATWASPRERNIGMVFQSYALYPTMSVAGNLSFGLRARGMPRAEVAARVQRAAALLQLEPLLARKPAQLSGGQRQRVAIGRALVRDARVYLLDEPLSNLDANLRAALRRELKLLHQRLGATMIYVTHDQVEALTLATRIAVLHQGRIQQLGTPAEVYARPANRFVAGFMGSPPMNFIEGRGSIGQGGRSFNAPQFDFPLGDYEPDGGPLVDGEELVLGVRPEQIRLTDSGTFHGQVTLIEPMGSSVVIWLQLGNAHWAALAPQHYTAHIGSTVHFAFDATTASLFRADDGARR